MKEWIPCKQDLPKDKIVVMAMNTEMTALSWLDGIDELGKRSWCHEDWKHADQFVIAWRYLEDDEADYVIKMAQREPMKWEMYGCKLGRRSEIIERS